jgi:hypothetical protein
VGRRDNQAYISLFSFQDVMASVIGILFFIVLMMCLDIVDQTTAAAKECQDSAITENIEKLRENIHTCDTEITRINQQIDQVSEKMQLSSMGDREVLEEVKKLNGRLKIMYVQLNQSHEKMTDAAQKCNSVRKELFEKKKSLDDLQRRIEECKSRIHSTPPVPRIAYIIDSRKDRLEPWLLEVSKDRLRVATKDGSSAVIQFNESSPEARLESLFEWVRQQSPKKHYFVLLIKPGSLDILLPIMKKLKELGFDIGTDLFPDEWDAF